MSHPYYPAQDISSRPSWAEFGNFGPNGSYACKLSARGGGLRSCMFYAYPLTQTAVIPSETTLHVNSANLNASDNGFEGVTVQVRLLDVVDNNVNVVWNSRVLTSGNKEKWFPFRTNEGEFVRRSIIEQPPDDLVAPYLDICIICKAPSGFVIISNVENHNRYEKKYPIIIENGGSKTDLTLDIEEIPKQFIDGGTTHTFTVKQHRRLWYLRTLPVSIRKGERFAVEYDFVLSGEYGGSISSITEAPVIGLMLKLRRKGTGTYDSEEITSYQGNLTGSPENSASTGEQHVKGMSTGSISYFDYDQAEVIFYAKSRFNPSGPTEWALSHDGAYVNIRTRGQEENG